MRVTNFGNLARVASVSEPIFGAHIRGVLILLLPLPTVPPRSGCTDGLRYAAHIRGLIARHAPRAENQTSHIGIHPSYFNALSVFGLTPYAETICHLDMRRGSDIILQLTPGLRHGAILYCPAIRQGL